MSPFSDTSLVRFLALTQRVDGLLLAEPDARAESFEAKDRWLIDASKLIVRRGAPPVLPY